MDTHTTKKKERAGRGLLELVFTWSLKAVLNKDLYKGQVKNIPKTFTSPDEYLKSFVMPLVEETHADLYSNMTSMSRPPVCEVLFVNTAKDFELPKELFYDVTLKPKDLKKKDIFYEPEVGDLVALTDVFPRSIEDLKSPGRPYLVAYVQAKSKRNSDSITVFSSKPIEFRYETKNKYLISKLFVVYLTTNIRMYRALNSELKGGNMNVIKHVLQLKNDGEHCAACNSITMYSDEFSHVRSLVKSSGLNDSQESAIMSSVSLGVCKHQNCVNLIWGPPGTGKTKTIGQLLFCLLKMRRRVVTCAPTNIAVLTVTGRLLNIVKESLEYDNYGLGDVILFGNRERMKIDDCYALLDLFLDHRVNVLAKCFSGYRHNLEAMISLLEDPKEQYKLYSVQKKVKEDETKDDNEEGGLSEKDETDNDEEIDIQKDEQHNRYLNRNQDNDSEVEDEDDCEFEENEEDEQYNRHLNQNQDNEDVTDDEVEIEIGIGDEDDVLFDNETSNDEVEEYDSQRCKRIWMKAIVEAMNANKNKEEQEKEKPQGKGNSGGSSRISTETFNEFVLRRFSHISEMLKSCMVDLYTHLPTSYIPLEVVKSMVAAIKVLSLLETKLRQACSSIDGSGVRLKLCLFNIIIECLDLLKSLPQSFAVPNFSDSYMLKDFCLSNARLIFCTASSSARLHTEGMAPVELLVIDEAAQLKECESTIPLQVSGLQHAILIGDEQQLSPMVQSKISAEADFGRSLFQRLVQLGHKKQLLDVQYRMHPSISLFPNREFYSGKILDASVVLNRNYEKRFLQGNMYGPFSFISIAHGKEQYDGGRSAKNLVEVAVVAEILASLYKEFVRTKRKVSVGVISPYHAQVYAVQDKIRNLYTHSGNGFSVSVRSVDGFQGSEEDVIIISTVRSNWNGQVGFMSNQQRTNVALTRAKYCLWILGSGATLKNSNTIWQRLVVEAEKRGCYFEAEKDDRLAKAISNSVVELQQLEALLRMDPPLFRKSKWKICYSSEFWKSIEKKKNVEIRKEVLSLLEKLARGWRELRRQRTFVVLEGTSSQLLQKYKINSLLSIIWSVDIHKEDDHYIQVVKVWDVLPSEDIPKLAERLDRVFETYTVNKMNRCKVKSVEGNLAVPMKWHEDLGEMFESDIIQGLSKPFTCLSLRERSEASSPFPRNYQNRNMRGRGRGGTGFQKNQRW